MRAIQAVKAGGPEVLRVIELPEPKPGPGQLLVKVEAAGINFIDTYRRSGTYAMTFPHIPGTEGAGTVLELGPDVTEEFVVGQRVAWCDSMTGSYAEVIAVDADRVVPVPSDMPAQLAAAALLQGMTADYLVHSTFPVSSEHVVVLYAAAGGTGLLATQMIHATGARLIAIAGSRRKTETVQEFGIPVEDTISLRPLQDLTAELPPLILERTGPDGAHVVYDSVGRDTFAASLRCVRRRGTLVVFGGSSGQVAPFDIQELNARGSIYLTRPTLRDYTATRPELLERAGRLFDAVMARQLVVAVGETYPLADAAEAHRQLAARATIGKTLLAP